MNATFDLFDRIAAEHARAEGQRDAPEPDRRTTTLTPLGRALALARQTGHAVAALPTAEERVTVLAAVPSSALEAIQAERAATT
ncbi:MAG TPA: hypothetical protein VFH48_34460 [Chloroflexota bacterium]|nr:hypothetical protein [Chloroflexota bacterium]